MTFGYSLLKKPMKIDEIIAVKVVNVWPWGEHKPFIFGLTNLEPSTMISSTNPSINIFECSDDLKVKKDDILQFQMKNDGRILFSKNDQIPICIFQISTSNLSTNLWPFFKMGKVSSIELIEPKNEIFMESTKTASVLNFLDFFNNVF
uniref:NHR domain-containing protein n=1 Tax=Panagrolaimus sp. JU765 TaxID=591449 RepID=A0AC34R5V0_9BILA